MKQIKKFLGCACLALICAFCSLAVVGNKQIEEQSANANSVQQPASTAQEQTTLTNEQILKTLVKTTLKMNSVDYFSECKRMYYEYGEEVNCETNYCTQIFNDDGTSTSFVESYFDIEQNMQELGQWAWSNVKIDNKRWDLNCMSNIESHNDSIHGSDDSYYGVLNAYSNDVFYFVGSALNLQQFQENPNNVCTLKGVQTESGIVITVSIKGLVEDEYNAYDVGEATLKINSDGLVESCVGYKMEFAKDDEAIALVGFRTFNETFTYTNVEFTQPQPTNAYAPE